MTTRLTSLGSVASALVLVGLSVTPAAHAEEQAPLAPAALTAPAPPAPPAVPSALEAPAQPAAPAALEASAEAEPSLEEMEARLIKMATQMDSVARELERAHQESQQLVEQTLKLLRQQQAAASASNAPAASAGAPASRWQVGAIPSTSTENPFPSAAGTSNPWGVGAAIPPTAQATPAPSVRVQLTLPDLVDDQTEVARRRSEERSVQRQVQLWERAERRSSRVFRRSPNSAASRTLFSGNGIVEAGETVEEFVVFSGNGEVRGDVEGDAVLLAGNLLVRKGARIGGDAVVLAGNLSVEPGAQIGGNAVVTAGELDVDEAANVGGDRVQMGLSPWAFDEIRREISRGGANSQLTPERETDDEVEEDDSGILESASDVLIRFLLLSASGLLLMTFLPARTQTVGRTLHRRMGAAAVTGILAAFSLAPLGLLMTVSVVGIPLVPVLVAGATFAVVMGLAAASLEIGRRLPLSRRAPAWLLAAGAGVVAVLTEVPFLGVIAGLSLALLGLGAVLLSRFGEADNRASA